TPPSWSASTSSTRTAGHSWKFAKCFRWRGTCCDRTTRHRFSRSPACCMSAQTSNPSFPLYKPTTTGALRLFCFPPAGATARSYVRWQFATSDQEAGAPKIDVVAVELPGHGARRKEACVTEWAPLVKSFADAITSLGEAPYAFFGYSL